MDWNSSLYLKYKNERTQPAVDLVNRISINEPKKIIDIGCGPGNSAAALASRFTSAKILGIDSSEDMILSAKKSYPHLDFMLCDAENELENIGERFDVVFSNACIQWIPNHHKLLKNMMMLLTDGGVLAVQTPMNYEEPVHLINERLTKSEKWKHKIKTPRIFNNLKADEYYDILADISTSFEMWQTTYFHKMKSHNEILEWYRGTGLRPYLNELSEDDKPLFENDILSELIKEYPVQKNGDVIFRFPRFFFTAIK